MFFLSNEISFSIALISGNSTFSESELYREAVLDSRTLRHLIEIVMFLGEFVFTTAKTFAIEECLFRIFIL